MYDKISYATALSKDNYYITKYNFNSLLRVDENGNFIVNHFNNDNNNNY